MFIWGKLKFSKSVIVWLVILTCLASCITQNNSGGRRKKTSKSTQSQPGTTEEPSFKNNLNFFQSGAVTSSSTFSINFSSTDGFTLRGKEVDTFIKNDNTNNVQCLIARVPDSIDKKVLIFAARPQFFFNFSSNTQEYYYLMDPADTLSNKDFCNKASLITNVTASLGVASSQLAFSLADLCPSCAAIQLTSNLLYIGSSAGIQVTDINTSYLSLKLLSSSTSVGELSCSGSSECKAKGYDCCSLGQCVFDRQVKDGVDKTSAEFLQAQQDILADPASIFNYSNFYHICSISVVPSPTPTPITPPEDLAAKRFTELQELYECVNPQDGEMSLCTITYESASQTGTYTTGNDDRSFVSTHTNTDTSNALPATTINRIIFAGQTLYENNTTLVTGSVTLGAGNDNLDDPQSITLSHTPQGAAKDTDLKIRYQVDGSCQKISNSIAKCYKVYVQGQNLGEVDDHFPASNEFLLPFYADTDKTIKVEVDETTKLVGSHWQLIQTDPARIEFLGTGLQVFDTQVIKITFFVDLSNHNVLQRKLTSLEKIADICNCADTNCNLKPVLDGGSVIDYTCLYPQPDAPEPPLQQTVILSSKTAPHRYYDDTGVYQSKVNFDTPAQEGTEFKYNNLDLLKPNNVDKHIGFNEIYGSFTTRSDSARPALEVAVKKDKSYDIFVDSGNFSTCFFCGTDYYSNIVKIFPQNFLFKGGGYVPEENNTNRFSTSATYRADDLLFGRACFVPATMIPWTHDPDSDRQQQRMKRLAAQHFMFANGYQRDWYGFDYGSVIGSFDGVTWFSVGNQRRIKAQSNKLFLAVNAYFSDLTMESSFSVTISDASSVPASGSTVTSDFDSDGAQCQKHHVCDTDKDCIAQLGYEYTCETITSMSTRWPEFDTNGLETPGSEKIVSFLQLFGASAGGSKRCVYRGRGAPCVPDYDVQDGNSSYNGTTKTSLHACSHNTHCQKFLDGTNQAKFNSKISRYGKSAKVLNASSSVSFTDLDTFGLGVKILGRPYDWIGDQTITPEAQSALSNNDIGSLCIPGRDPEPATELVKNQNTNVPGLNHLGDQVLNIGMTPKGQLGLDHYLSSCSIHDSTGEYFNLVSGNLTKSLDDTDLARLAGNQAVPTNSLVVLETLSKNDIITDFDNLQVEEPMLQENRCLRAPGSACFSNTDCAPSKIITDKVSKIDSTDTSIWSTLNKYEILFWQEELICGQEKKFGEEGFSLKKNRCCRDLGKKVTIPTLVDQSHHEPVAGNDSSIPTFDNFNIPGLGAATNGIDLDNASRYTRNSTVHDLMSDTSKYPKLQTARADACDSVITPVSTGCFDDGDFTTKKQFNTFAAIAERTCCSGHWIRNFNSEDNGGGHAWDPVKHQNIPKETFKCLNWLKCQPGAGTCAEESGFNAFTCEHTDAPDDPQCLARSISNSEASLTFEFLNTLELLGIPQIKVKSKQYINAQCLVDPDNQATSGRTLGSEIPLPNLITTDLTIAEYLDLSTTNVQYSANDSSNFNGNLKKIFSPDEITCCLPAGTQMNEGDDPKLCCTGFVNPQNDKCQLKDFTNLTVYFNRYVSSHAKKVSAGLFDQDSGFITSAATVEQLACESKVCASNKIARGVAVSNLKVPGHEGSDKGVKRWVDSNSSSNKGFDKLYDAGQRWNDDVYCVPFDSEVDTAIDCSQF